jgi:hypothetical protein
MISTGNSKTFGEGSGDGLGLVGDLFIRKGRERRRLEKVLDRGVPSKLFK